jgi:hypothetical protein
MAKASITLRILNHLPFLFHRRRPNGLLPSTPRSGLLAVPCCVVVPE